ncbi:metallophosphoesterase family protein [Chitinophaga rhizophila]|uniref:Calcineurin-like phosphoesterase family protein n=1 Tax=Chitinophaga rhizophila TaxID=2866212 RepID=A0ABS7GF67_9BACT|nr:hypothetical protein [Chitinophaga rhizophila]MBW8686332.1 hypothetical protein [Chitinophaga rhizophila]
MRQSFRVALQIPENERKYFSFRLHQQVNDAVTECKQSKKLLVISGIDGHFKTFSDLLIKSEVLDEGLNWNFGNNHLVILGNCIREQEESVEFLWFIYSLEERAELAGGAVHFILGTHELMNINAPWSRKQPLYAKRKSASRGAATALYDGNSEIRRWLLTKNIVEKIGSTLFIHGGIAREILEMKLSIREINAVCKQGYTQLENFFNPLMQKLLIDPYNLVNYGYSRSSANIELINETLQFYDAETIVTGNKTEQDLESYFDHKVINVCSNYSEGHPEALFVKRDRFYRLNMRGKLSRIKQVGLGKAN